MLKNLAKNKQVSRFSKKAVKAFDTACHDVSNLFFKNKWVAKSVINKKLSENPLECFDLHKDFFIGDQNRPVSIVFGFNLWKRDFIGSFLSEYRVAFVRGKTPWPKVQHAVEMLDSPMEFVFWGGRDKTLKREDFAARFAAEKGIKTIRMEDGFIRSIGLGANHVRPLSLVTDREGIYFDATRSSALESILLSYDFESDSVLAERSDRLLKVMRERGFSKYNLTKVVTDDIYPVADGKKRILVIGQVDTDASIALGCESGIRSNDLVRIACEENPKAEIYYKPHPEVLAGFKEDQDSYKSVAEICTILDGEISLAQALSGVEHVYTITSLAGFEALIQGKTVTCMGAPFYSGWGLTDDRQPAERRIRRLTLNNLFSAAYILYPQYICPVRECAISAEEAVFTLELMRHPVFRSLYSTAIVQDNLDSLQIRAASDSLLELAMDLALNTGDSVLVDGIQDLLSGNCSKDTVAMLESEFSIVDCVRFLHMLVYLPGRLSDISSLESHFKAYGESLKRAGKAPSVQAARKELPGLLKYCRVSNRAIQAWADDKDPLELFDLHKDFHAAVVSQPIAIAFGFNTWKRDFIGAFLADYRVAFVRGKTPWQKLASAIEALDGPVEFVFWGAQDDTRPREAQAAEYALDKGVQTQRMEDGFIRSIGLGASHIRPLSLVADSRGIYFDATRSSELENILLNYDFEADSVLAERSERLMTVMRERGFSKYNLKNVSTEDIYPARCGKKRVLVVGQVDTDASIALGCSKEIKSNDLARIAYEENLDAEIYYKPHPEVLAGFKVDQDSYKSVAEICTILDGEISLAQALNGVDHVYTITSLAGFEALIQGKTVTCMGAPFYSGWGLTDDRQLVERRGRQLALNNLFAAAYILYPEYICPVTEQRITVEGALLRLEFMRHPVLCNIFSGVQPGNTFMGKSLSELNEQLIALHGELGVSGSDDSLIDNAFGILNGEVSSRELELLSNQYGPHVCVKLLWPAMFGLRKQVRFDQAKHVLDEFIQWFNGASGKLPIAVVHHFYDDFTHSLRGLNGRSVNELPVWIGLKNLDSDDAVKAFVQYVRILANYCRYQETTEIINSVSLGDKNSWLKLARLFSRKALRSEVDGFQRQRLSFLCASRFLKLADKNNESFCRVIELVDRLECAAAQADIASVEKYVHKLLAFYHDDLTRPQFFETKAGTQQLKMCLRRTRSALDVLMREHPQLAADLFEVFQSAYTSETRSLLEAQLTYYVQGPEEFCNHVGRTPTILKKPRVKHFHSRVLRERTEFTLALQALRGSHSIEDSPQRSAGLQDEMDRLKFLQQTSDIVNSCPQPRNPRGVVALTSLNCLNSMAILAPVLLELKKQGFVVIHLSAGMLQNRPTGILSVDAMAGSIPLKYSDGPAQLDWDIDWERRKVEACGINFYQGVYEKLSIGFRRFQVDIHDPQVARTLAMDIDSCDKVLRTCLELQRVHESTGLPIVLMGGNSHAAPYSVFRDFALSEVCPGITFSAVNLAYENYYNNLSSKYAASMAIVDMNYNRGTRAPFLAVEKRFDRWLDNNRDSDAVSTSVSELINTNRAKTGVNSDLSTAESVSILEEIKAARRDGKKVICCFGKILCDLCVPYDGGPAHTDLVDWINHTIELLKDEDVLLLIKPHPHELRREIALDLVDHMRDVIPDELPGHVRFLNHSDFNVSELAGLLDLAILWNGTSGLELTIQGVPVMMCAHFGRLDYPVNLLYPESRSQYESFLKAKNFPVPSDDTSFRAAALLYYMGTDEVSLKNSYSLRPATNDKVGMPKWNHEALNEYFMNGDKYIETAAYRAVESVLNS